ncbi:hypothetical protein FXV77_16845 [Sphingobacterium phlebotomi]|uniref:Uncharacterized protein n=1 Tax=Sphingobacterium phlebotomi TaxID=2605433 RepID=A0A5D4GZ59_9SPHI|nr:hypothetical protein [Sphingobacterium phlebotomi]TYR33906.1 hypothetical protein FXV77_16845 [Sphingobacterium phlebotomi]
MKEIVKEHPLRPIILQFDLKKKALDFEIKALEAYYRMHDRTWETKQNLLRHKDAFLEIDVKTAELEYRLAPIKQQLDFIEAAFKLVDNVELPDMGERFTIDIVDFYTAVDSHNEDLRELHKQITTEMQWFDNWADHIYEKEDWFDEQDDEGDKLIHQVFRHYNDVSVDIVSLDRDQQEFFGIIGTTRNLQQQYFEYGEEVSEQYNRVHYASEEVYQRALRVKQYVDKHYPLDDK